MNNFSIKNLFFKRGLSEFSNLNLSFQGGEIICIIGNNGAGKSTLLKLCCKLISSNKGNITFNGIDITNISNEERSRFISYLPQSSTQTEGCSSLKFVALSDEIKRFLNGRDLPNDIEINHYKNCLEKFDALSLKNRDISSLSGGEWTRVQLARVWAQNTPVLILDEPDTGLDLKHLKDLSKQCTDFAAKNGIIIFCSHNINFSFSISSRIILIDKGKVILNSPTNDISSPEILEDHFKVKFSWIKSESRHLISPIYEAQ